MKYLSNFSSRKDIEKSYNCKIDPKAKILLAWYGYGDYSGSSFVLYELDGKLYEVNGSHCSCHGLEGQWQPEETTVAALRMRQFYWSDDDYIDGGVETKTLLNRVLDKLDIAAQVTTL
jgi:hypothetical protein